jgi:tetratricopeptide (TPR) repeat protein
MSFFPRAAAALVLAAASAAPADAARVRIAGLTHEQREARTRLAEGDRLMRVEQFARAIAEYESAERLDPLLVMAPYRIGRAKMALRDYDGAIEAYVRAQRSFTVLQSAGVEMKKALAAARDDEIRRVKEEMRDIDMQLQHLSPTSRAGRALHSRLRQLDGDLDAMENLRDSESPVAGERRMPPALLLATGSAYFRAGRLAEAERAYKAALESRGDLAEARNNLAVVYIETGRPALAAAEIAQAEKAGFKVHPELKRAVSNALN